MKKWHEQFKKTDELPINRLRDYLKCERCGHTLPMIDKQKGFCQFCGRYIFVNEKEEFKYRIKERLK